MGRGTYASATGARPEIHREHERGPDRLPPVVRRRDQYDVDVHFIPVLDVCAVPVGGPALTHREKMSHQTMEQNGWADRTHVGDNHTVETVDSIALGPICPAEAVLNVCGGGGHPHK